uniref:E3 ubiquitin-protein ligase RBBP6-like n=1 Tax=Saccoglossus kowalevskii TaxID=10224 RepID=A0ABM0LYE5_SACKO|nr:PREDICTED: E3 ubiquitin-protein ligase RBBP6-like [Saccoglossus kowalevskii]
MLDDNLSENSLNLPEGWIVCKSVKKNPDRVYYFNIINGEKSWEPPNQDGTKRKKKKKKSHSDTSSELKKSSQFDKSPGFEDKSWESTSSTTVGELLFSRTPPVRNKASQITEWLSGLGSPEFKKKSDSQDFKINSLSGLESAKFKDKFKVNKQQYDATNAKRKRKSCDNSQLTYDLPQATSQGYVSNNPRSSQFVHPVSPPVKSKKLRTAEAELQKDTISVKPVSNDSYKIKRLSQETAVIPVKHYSSHSTVRNNEAVSSLDPRRRQNKPDSSICHRDNSTASRSKHEINPTFSTSEFYPSICQSPPDACATNITAENSPKKKKKRAWKRKKKRSDSADFQKKVTLSRNTSIPVYRATSTDKCMKDSHTKPDAKTQEIIQSKKLKHCSMNETIVQLHTSERFASQDKRNKLITSKNLKPSRRSNTTSVDSSITRSDQINNNKSSDAVKSPKKAQMPNIEKHSHAFEKSAIKKRVVCDVKPIMISECKTPKSRERSRTCVSPDSTFQEKKPSSVVEKSESTPVVVSSTCIRKESNEVNKNDKRDSESDSQMDVSTESAPLSYFAGPNLNDFSEVVDMDVDNEDHLMSQLQEMREIIKIDVNKLTADYFL